jgi:glycosyltransferase involved in cell wall biosynthesis
MTRSPTNVDKTSVICLHAAPICDGHISGPGVSVPALVRAQHALGARVALLVTTRAGRVTRDLPFPVFHAADFGWRHCLDRLPSPFNHPTLVNFHSTYIPVHAWIAACARKKSIAYVITPRGGMTILAQARKHWKKQLGNFLFFKRMVHHAAAIHCLTPNEALEASVWKRPTFVVPNGVHLSFEDGGRVAALAQRSKFGWSEGDVVFLFLGRIDAEHKGLDLLLSGVAWARQRTEGRRARVLIVGPDAQGDRAALEKLAIDLGLRGTVVFHEPVMGNDKEEMFQAADVFVHTSRYEGLPMAVLEGLSWARPCLVTPGTNIADEVSRAGAGWVAEPTAESIGECILKALAAGEKRLLMGNAGRALVEREYTWESVARRMLCNYERFRQIKPAGGPSLEAASRSNRLVKENTTE